MERKFDTIKIDEIPGVVTSGYARQNPETGEVFLYGHIKKNDWWLGEEFHIVTSEEHISVDILKILWDHNVDQESYRELVGQAESLQKEAYSKFCNSLLHPRYHQNFYKRLEDKYLHHSNYIKNKDKYYRYDDKGFIPTVQRFRRYDNQRPSTMMACLDYVRDLFETEHEKQKKLYWVISSDTFDQMFELLDERKNVIKK